MLGYSLLVSGGMYPLRLNTSWGDVNVRTCGESVFSRPRQVGKLGQDGLH